MAGRTALLSNCSQSQAEKVRETALRERRTLSGYVLNIVLRAVDTEERFFAHIKRLGPLPSIRSAGPRACLLVRCSVEEARRIRATAQRRHMTMCGYALYCVERSWQVENIPPTLAARHASPLNVAR